MASDEAMLVEPRDFQMRLVGRDDAVRTRDEDCRLFAPTKLVEGCVRFGVLALASKIGLANACCMWCVCWEIFFKIALTLV